MVQLTALWLPILLAAVFVFIVSSIIHMVLGYHRTDFQKVPSEDEVMDALRKFDIPPGDYQVPCPGGLDVFRFAGTTAFAGYSLALVQNSIWAKRGWGSTLKSMFDGLIYALLTAGTFGWLWPH